MSGIMMNMLGNTFGGGSLDSLSFISRADGTDSTTATVTMPSGIQSGDLLIIQDFGPDVTSLIDGNIPSGFTKIVDSEHAAVDQRVHYKIATGSESGSTVTGQTGSNEDMSVFVFRGSTAIASVSVATSLGTDNTNYPSVSISPNTSDPTIVLFAAGSRGSSYCNFSSQSPSGIWTDYTDINSGGNGEIQAFSWYFSASGVSGTHTMQMNSTYASRQTILAAALTLGA